MQLENFLRNKDLLSLYNSVKEQALDYSIYQVCKKNFASANLSADDIFSYEKMKQILNDSCMRYSVSQKVKEKAYALFL